MVSLMRTLRGVFLVALAACGSCGNEWPLSVHLAGAFPTSDPVDAPGVAGESVAVPAGDYGANEMFLFGAGDDTIWVRIDLPEGPRWLDAPSPLAPSADEFLRGLGTRVHVSFFEDGDRAIVVSERGTMAVQCSTGRVTMLDRRTSELEGCRMVDGRRSYTCNRDMAWTTAEFDPDGRDLNAGAASFWD